MDPVKPRCAQCGKRPIGGCAVCKDGVDAYGVPSPTFYCSRSCQAKHSEAHKTDCQNANYRKQLYRATFTTMRLWVHTRHNAFDMKIANNVEKNGDEQYVERGEANGRVLFDFPRAMCTDEHAMSAVEFYKAGREAVGRMHELIAAGLEGSYVNIQEVVIGVPANARRAVITNDSDADLTHVLFKVDLKDGNCYALDLTRCQFRQCRAFEPWTAYLEAVGGNVLETHEIGWCASQLQQADDDRRLALNTTSESAAPDIATKSRIAQNNVTKCMKWAVQAAAESVQTSIKDLVTKFSPDYSVGIIFEKMRPFLLWQRKDD